MDNLQEIDWDKELIKLDKQTKTSIQLKIKKNGVKVILWVGADAIESLWQEAKATIEKIDDKSLVRDAFLASILDLSIQDIYENRGLEFNWGDL